MKPGRRPWRAGSTCPQRCLSTPARAGGRDLDITLKDLPGAEIWTGVDRKWNYVNYLDAEVTFRDGDSARTLTSAIHRAIDVEA